jgi:hypothetical protein
MHMIWTHEKNTHATCVVSREKTDLNNLYVPLLLEQANHCNIISDLAGCNN